MTLRALPLLLVAAALLGGGRTGFYLLLAAVAAAATAALAAYGRLVELPGRAPGENAARLDAALGALALLLALVAAASYDLAVAPGLAEAAAILFLPVSAAQALAGVRTAARRPRPSPAR